MRKINSPVYGTRRPIDCKKVVLAVRSRFPELGDKQIDVRLEANHCATLFHFAPRRKDGGYDIDGRVDTIRLPEDTPDFARVARYAIAHEMAHIVLGHMSLTSIALSKLPLLNKFYLHFIERQTDREVIQRGMGEDLCATAEICESLGSRSSKYLNAQEARELIRS